jgi:hypothetical protein
MANAKTSLRAEERGLREKMRGLGMSRRQIAVEFARRYGYRPRAAWRHAFGWSLTEAAEQINVFAGHAGLNPDGITVTMTSSHLCEYENWPGEGTKPAGRRPTPYLLSLLAEVYGCTVHDLLDVADYDHIPAADLLVIGKVPSADDRRDDPSTKRTDVNAAHLAPRAKADEEITRAAAGESAWIRPFIPASDALERLSEKALIQVAAHESSAHAEWAEASNVGNATLEQLDADVRRISLDYVHSPPLPMFAEMLRVRNRIYLLLAGRQKPAATAQLHLMAGMLCGLLANASTDLGYRDAAAEQARAAWAYGEIVGHDGLRAWTRGMQALIEYWSGRPEHAVRLAQSASRYADAGTAGIRLGAVEARAWSLTGNAREASRCLSMLAGTGRPGAGREYLHDEVGGIFGFEDSKRYCYTGAAFIHLGQADAALDAASRAVALYAASDVKDRSYGAESLARVDMAMAYLLKRNVDGAAASLAPVLATPVGLRIAQLADRLSGVQRCLSGSRFTGAREARDLGEQISAFVGVTLVQELEDHDRMG